jgi:hypothetical protein
MRDHPPIRSLICRAAVTVAAASMLAAGTVAIAAEPAGAEAAATVTTIEAALPANAGPSPDASVVSVSCASAGNCAAVGDYTDSSGDIQGLLLTETSGTWATGIEAALPAGAAANPAALVSSVSCASPGTCTAVGYYTDSSGNRQGLLLDETASTWAAGAQAPLPTNGASLEQMDSVSCASAGNCTAVGDYLDTSNGLDGLLLTETSGTWAAAEAPLPAGALQGSVALTSVSCASAGNCSAVGFYSDTSGNTQGLLLSETSGTWAAAQAALPANAGPTPSASLASVSCASAGNCTAVGSYATNSNLQGLLLDETSGTWANGVQAPLPANGASLRQSGSVSCVSAGNCTAVGSYADSSGNAQGLLLTETSGTWAAAEAALPANAGSDPGVGLASVSCVSAGNCTAVGNYADNSFHEQGLLVDESSGTWATGVEAPLPANAGWNPNSVDLPSVSCASAGNCTAVGWYTDTSGSRQGLLLTQSAGLPTVAGIRPSSGPLTGGTTVTVTGSGFTGATAVGFGSVAASSFTVNSDTSITVTAPAAASVGTVDVTVTTPAGTSAVSAADQYSYIYAFTGFLDPVANPPVVNMVHAGQSIAIQFQLDGDFGLGIVAAGYPTAEQVSCATGVPVNTTTETDTAGASGLQYDATTGTYTYVWKTSKASRGICQVFTLGLNDGTTYTAIFEYVN